MEACNDYRKENADLFKEKMESYFRLDEVADRFGLVVEKPDEISLWFDILNVKYLKSESQESVNTSLTRFLESTRYNTGLNFISGIIRYIMKDYKNIDGRERLLDSLKRINRYSIKEKDNIIEKTLLLAKEMMDAEGKEALSEAFTTNIEPQGLKVKVYTSLEDNFCLNSILTESIEKVHEVIIHG